MTQAKFSESTFVDILQWMRKPWRAEGRLPTRLARKFFEGKGMDVNIIKIEGSVELADGNKRNTRVLVPCNNKKMPLKAV